MAKNKNSKVAPVLITLFSLAVIAVVVITLIIYLFGEKAKEPPHEHAFAETLTYDDDFHWYAATCDHTEEVKGKVPHAFETFVRTVTPTCNTEGFDEYECVCGKIRKSNFTAVVDHEYVDGFCKYCNTKEPSKGLEYTLSENGTYYIVTGTGILDDPDVVIPSEHEGLPVTEIAERAFENSAVTSLVIPESVTHIGNLAFNGCASLKSITLPKTLSVIGWSIFTGCTDLTINYGDTVEKWKELIREVVWNDGLKGYTIRCTDGILEYPANVA